MTKATLRVRMLPALGKLMLCQFVLCAVIVSCVTVQAVPEEQENMNGFRDWLQGAHGCTEAVALPAVSKSL